MILNAILFCFILLLCIISYGIGFLVGILKKRPRKDPPVITEDEKRKIEKLKRETENFWGYDGTEQI